MGLRKFFRTPTILEPVISNRDSFVHYVKGGSENSSILEIGPLNRPMFIGSNVSYFDIYTTNQLKAKAVAEGLDASNVPQINYSHPNGDLSVIQTKFALVVSAHCVEHQPDLINHLLGVANVLSENGRYALVIPDHRFCFDHYLPPSKLTDVVKANQEQLIKPSIWSVIEHRALTVHNDSKAHWKQDSGKMLVDLRQRWEKAIQEYDAAEGNYIDVHCWQFTPDIFNSLIQGLNELGLIPFRIEALFQTPQNDLEFFAVLKKY